MHSSQSLLHLRYRLRVGKTDVLNFLHKVGGLDPRRVGRIELRCGEATIEIPRGCESRLVEALDGQRIENRIMGSAIVRVSADSTPGSGRAGEDHLQRLARLLEVEKAAASHEARERFERLSRKDAERTGTSLVDLIITSTDDRGDLGGRYLMKFAKRKRCPLPWTRLEVGSPVALAPDTGRRFGWEGVVCTLTDKYLWVSFSDEPDDLRDHGTWRVDLWSAEEALKWQQCALHQLREAHGNRLAELRAVLLGERQPEFGSEQDETALDPGLNCVQREAVRFALSAHDLALICGPPGTGKTTTAVELIRRAVRRGQKVLACAPNNLAVNNVFERLVAHGEKAVCLGRLGDVTPDLTHLLAVDHPNIPRAQELIREGVGLRRRRGYAESFEDRKSLRDEAQRLVAHAVHELLDTTDVLCAATADLGSRLLGPQRFDLAVIDESCQSTEAACWIPLLSCDRVVLVGDPCQLPPTVVSQVYAAAEGFEQSLFERLVALYGQAITRRLTVQYRMHRVIMDFSSLGSCETELEADASVREHLLTDLPDIGTTRLTGLPVEFIDTAGAGFAEEVGPGGESRLNRQEASLVCRKVRELLDSGVPADDLGVIAPYTAQVRLLHRQLSPSGVEVDMVDGFQGREKEAVVISLVCSNPQGEIGSLSNVRRMNVALTRARRKLLLVGDSATLSAHPFYRRAIEYSQAIGAYRTVWEEDDVG
jgi:hypothetical protein